MGFRWPWKAEPVQPTNLRSISDPALAEWFGVGTPNYSGVAVGEGTALTLSAVYRAISLISGTIASLPMRTIREVDGEHERVRSFLDDPGGPDGPTKFEWIETVLLHLLLHGNAFLLHVRNAAGALVALVPLHPMCVAVDPARPDDNPKPLGGKWFRVTHEDGSKRDYDASELTHIPALCLDGIRGLSPISIARNSLGVAVAGDRAAANMFSKGALIAGLVSSEEDVEPEEATQLFEQIRRAASGYENANGFVMVNKRLKFTPWTMSAQDAQFLQSRQFQIEEISRWYGVPPHLLMQTEKQTSWGTGVAEQNRALARGVLQPWTARIEQRLSRLLPAPRFVEFDFAGLERPDFATEIKLLIEQKRAGLITTNEARKIRNMPPVPGGDELVPDDAADGELM